MRYILLLTAVFMASACTSTFEPVRPYVAVESARFASDYTWVWENCASRFQKSPDRRFSQLRFWEIAGNLIDHPDLGKVWGVQSGNDLYFSRVSIELEWVRRHELLHAQLNSRSHHPAFALCGLLAEQQGP